MIELQDFDLERDNLSPLFRAVSDDASIGQEVVKKALSCTGGHPYLTLRVCEEFVSQKRTSPEDVDLLANQTFTNLEELQTDTHFIQVVRFLREHVDDKLVTLSVYRRIWRGEDVRDQMSSTHTALKLAGIVKRDRRGLLVVRNAIYHRIFTDEWAASTAEVDAKQREAAVGWQASAAFSERTLRQPLVDYKLAFGAYQSLRENLAYDGNPAELWAAFIERHALRAGQRPQRDEALLWGLKALSILPTDDRARVVSNLIKMDYVQLAMTFRHLRVINVVAFSPDGQIILTGSEDGTARLWQTATGQPLGEPLRHEGSGWAAAFSPDGQIILTGSEDGTARLWQTATGQPLGEPLRHQTPGWVVVAFSPDGQIVLTGSEDGTARLWQTATGQPLGEPLRHPSGVWAVAFSPDGTMALTGGLDNTARLWQTATGQPLREPLRHHSRVRAVAFSPDGQIVLTGSEDGTARLWQTATGQPLGEPLRHPRGIKAVAFSPDGQMVLTGSEDGTARLWRAKTDQPLGELLRHDSLVKIVIFSPEGTTLLTGSLDGTVRLWQTATGQLLSKSLRHPDGVCAAAFSPDGQIVLTGSEDGTVRLWQTATGQPLREQLEYPGGAKAVAFSPDGQMMLTGSLNGTARLWQATTGWLQGELLHHPGGIWVVAFSPDSQMVLTGGLDGTVRLWKTATGQSLIEPLRHHSRIRAAAFSPDGQMVLAGSEDGAVRLWQTATGQPLGEPLRHPGGVRAVAFSPDGQIVLTATQWWIRAARFKDKGMQPMANIYLLDPWMCESKFSFLDPSAHQIQVAISPTTDSIRVITFHLDRSNADPRQGEPVNLLLESWQNRLGLRINEAGEIIPYRWHLIGQGRVPRGCR